MQYTLMTTHARAGDHEIFDGVATSTFTDGERALQTAREYAGRGDINPDILVFDVEESVGILIKGNQAAFKRVLDESYGEGAWQINS